MDRCQIVPRHSGRHVLPNSPLFSKLLQHARRGRLALRDVHLDVEKTYRQVVDDVLAFRDVLLSRLSPKTLQALSDDDEVYIGVLAAGGYEFTIAMLTVLALGAAAVPIYPQAPDAEVLYIAEKARLVAILTSRQTDELGRRVAAWTGTRIISVLPNLPRRTVLSSLETSLSSDPPVDQSKPGIVIFTSGTTGRPKGVVHRRLYTHETATAIGEGYDLNEKDVLLHVLPVHHTTGLATSFFPFLCAGACIEFRPGSDAKWIWERWLQGGLTVFSAVPTILMRLKWYFERAVVELPKEEQNRYVQAARQFRAVMCGSSALQDNVQEFWTRLRGQPILARYGATEIPGCLKVPINIDHRSLPRGCVGLPVPGVELKLSEEGELLVKSPYMFSRYLDDPQATREAHDEQGWYITGDIARRHGHFYTIIGRSSVDIIKSGGYKISAVDIERACLALPYITEVAVVGVPDEEYGQRVGAIVTAKKQLAIDELRADLRQSLAGYKLPTLLRVLDKEISKGDTGKVQKKLLGSQLFPANYEQIREVQVWKSGMRARL